MQNKTWNKINIIRQKHCVLSEKEIKSVISEKLNEKGFIGPDEFVFYDDLSTRDWTTNTEKLEKVFLDITRKLDGVVLCIASEDEEDNYWANYYSGGKSHYANGTIAYEPFDPTKLK